MRWNHLPVAGGIYDQDPEFIDGITELFRLKAKKEEKDAKKREAEMNAAKHKAKMR